jgi:hypothetical protein
MKRVPCVRCNGRGVELTALEQWPAIQRALLNQAWPETRIDELRETLKPDEILVAARGGGVDLKSPAGERTFDLYRRKDARLQ